MHERGFCHSDLKLENLMLGASYELKITDLGFSSRIGDTLFACKGTAK